MKRAAWLAAGLLLGCEENVPSPAAGDWTINEIIFGRGECYEPGVPTPFDLHILVSNDGAVWVEGSSTTDGIADCDPLGLCDVVVGWTTTTESWLISIGDLASGIIEGGGDMHNLESQCDDTFRATGYRSR